MGSIAQEYWAKDMKDQNSNCDCHCMYITLTLTVKALYIWVTCDVPVLKTPVFWEDTPRAAEWKTQYDS